LIVVDGNLPENIHFKWSKANKPIIHIPQREEVRLTLPDCSVNQVKESWTTNDLNKLDTSKLDGAVGPLFVEGAEPGCTLEVEILKIQTATWGYSVTDEHYGLLKGKFENNLTIWDLKEGYAEPRSNFPKGIRVPINPFLGVMGVAPDVGEFGMIAPQRFGGNMDNKLLTAGSRLYLPILIRGGLFSAGDPHAAQGDGESGGTGLETRAIATLRFNVIKDVRIDYPRAIVNQSSNSYIVTMGISDDLYKASEIAMANMVDELKTRGISGGEAYVLCSLVGDLRISELVDEPNHVVSMTFPLRHVPGHS